MNEIETIRIVKNNGRTGYAIINKADFDPKRHEAFDTPESGPTVAELKDRLKGLGVSIPRGASKAEMIDLLAAAESDKE